MNLNFQETYANFSNVDLLKISQQPHEYQAEAVEAARLILEKRVVTEEEEQQVTNFLYRLENVAQSKNDKRNFYKEKATDFLQPILEPGTEIKPAKWLNILLAFIVLQYLWSIYKTVQVLVLFMSCPTCRFDVWVALQIFQLLYIPVILYLLYRKRSWGWILLFAENLFAVLSQLLQSFIYFKYWDPKAENVVSFFLPIVIKAAFALFLWRNEIADFFHVTTKVKEKTALVTMVIVLLVFVVLNIVF